MYKQGYLCISCDHVITFKTKREYDYYAGCRCPKCHGEIVPVVMEKGEYELNCVAMAIVNFTNETNGVEVPTRQANNDKCYDFAVEKLKSICENARMGEEEKTKNVVVRTRPQLLGYPRGTADLEVLLAEGWTVKMGTPMISSSGMTESIEYILEKKD